jgi:hypothetical protein
VRTVVVGEPGLAHHHRQGFAGLGLAFGVGVGRLGRLAFGVGGG